MCALDAIIGMDIKKIKITFHRARYFAAGISLNEMHGVFMNRP